MSFRIRQPVCRRWWLLAALVGVLALGGCATGPRFDTQDTLSTLTPARVAMTDEAAAGQQVVWGGVIVNTRNLEEATQLEILGYPLDRRQRPRTEGTPQGRFMARVPGYLESVDYSPGRLLTLTGTLEKTVTGQVGETPYRYPVLGVDNHYLWPREEEPATTRPRFNIGIGVILTN
ncbi:Slp family lipoprotein [Ectothiorhodospira haloalkaliphila]|uniref:Slp family lipoprotein n=1 Tax=Ectothiorhodospira haloalkaliphila TaxID=421628 RepID=UPI001EE8708B|nr:Slp family lipoprotein [Ectothiorhodospira haloalkaliphila]MCG5524400.1 Slp family lipoprotein [Ectothiorhodospira haloalkaliphila]